MCVVLSRISSLLITNILAVTIFMLSIRSMRIKLTITYIICTITINGASLMTMIAHGIIISATITMVCRRHQFYDYQWS